MVVTNTLDAIAGSILNFFRVIGTKIPNKPATIIVIIIETDIIIVPLMCVMCVALPFVLVTIAPRFISAAEVNLFFLLETILGPVWVWMVIKEQPSNETIYGGAVIIITIAIHSFLAIKKTQLKST